jgi:hypothetical protein
MRLQSSQPQLIGLYRPDFFFARAFESMLSDADSVV